VKVTVVTASGVTPSDAKICMVAVHVPVWTDAGSKFWIGNVVGVVLMLTGKGPCMVKTDRSGCWKVIR